MSVTSETEYRWVPNAQQVGAANLTRFLQRMGLDSYEELLEECARDVRPFNDAIVQTLDLMWDRPWDHLLDLSRGVPFARWFVGAQYNAAAHCLDGQMARGRAEVRALIWEGEDGALKTMTFGEVRSAVTRLGGVLRALGVEKGDTVGIFMPLIPETAVGLLAIAYIGAIAVPAFSGYGPQALGGRLADAGAKVLLTVDGVRRRGKPVAMKTIADEALALAPSVKHVLVYRRAQIEVPMESPRDLDWELSLGQHRPLTTYERTDANDPLMLLFTSGSTGKPKGVVHVHAGFPIKAMIDQHLCMDMRDRDRMLWFTDIGWMMGPWLIFGTLGLGGSAVLYEGAPDYPGPDRLWSVCEAHGVTHLGIAPTAIRALMVHGTRPVQDHSLVRLRILASSGEAWNTAPWKWFATAVGAGKAPIINYSGGTEIGGGIVGCFPTMPLVPNSFHGPIPGMVADVYDSEGKPVRGDVGELVLKAPWIGMTQSFWGGDAATRDNERYLATYWERFAETWVHGDWCVVDEEGFWYIRGRSDDTINVAGKRVGPSEFENALVSDRRVKEAAAIAVPDEIKGDVVVCLVVPKRKDDEGDEARGDLMRAVENALGRSLLPKAIYFVDDLPRTRNL
ncbi:MAG: AMP-binding protein, partial [Candidatus Eremiobacteraeota bacterium]|nr:AMP-binding protein [Candidatus Eremiobacteraeota bacterium]